jgi:hypothetical protein
MELTAPMNTLVPVAQFLLWDPLKDPDSKRLEIISMVGFRKPNVKAGSAKSRDSL